MPKEVKQYIEDHPVKITEPLRPKPPQKHTVEPVVGGNADFEWPVVDGVSTAPNK